MYSESNMKENVLTVETFLTFQLLYAVDWYKQRKKIKVLPILAYTCMYKREYPGTICIYRLYNVIKPKNLSTNTHEIKASGI